MTTFKGMRSSSAVIHMMPFLATSSSSDALLTKPPVTSPLISRRKASRQPVASVHTFSMRVTCTEIRRSLVLVQA